MGCWNETCMLSNLPILSGEKVYAFILEQAVVARLTHHSYPDEMWTPFIFFFEGEYDDYGGLEKMRGPMLKTIVDTIKEDLLEIPSQPLSARKPILKESFTAEVMIDSLAEGRLCLTNVKNVYDDREKIQLTNVFIKKQILDGILSEYRTETFSHKENKNLVIGFKDLKKTFEESIEFLWNLPIEDSELRCLRLDHYDLEMGKWLGDFRYGTIPLNLVIFDALKNRDAATLKEIAYQCAVSVWLKFFMNDARKIWSPQSGSGSQSTDMNAQALLISLAAKEIQRLSKEMNDL